MTHREQPGRVAGPSAESGDGPRLAEVSLAAGHPGRI
jgi:hypothetical protein